MAKDPAFLFYSGDFLTGTMFMSNEEVGQYIKTLCLLHQHAGRLPKHKIEKAVGKLSELVLEKLHIDKENNLFNKRLMEETIKRNDYCSSRRKNILHRYKSTTHVKHMNIHMENENEDENRIDNVSSNIKGGMGGKVFVVPTLEEVNEYCKVRNNNIDAVAFIDFYTSKGWFIGKNKMKDWKAAVRTWENSRKEEYRARPTQAQVNSIASMSNLHKKWEKEDAEKSI